MRRRTKVALIMVPLLGAFVWRLSWLTGGEFGALEVCQVCGCMRLERRTLWIPRYEMKETTLSRYYERHQAGRAHEHEWLFGSGGGGPIMCALGAGSALYPVLDNERLPVTLERLREHAGEAVAEEWRRRLLDPRNSSTASAALGWLGNEGVPFADAYKNAERWYARGRVASDRDR